MAKLKDDEISVDALNEFLEGQSDFSFELKVLKKLRDHGFNCEHGGTYEDTQTSKLRQFDLRTSIKYGCGLLHLAAECKQLRPNFPLLVQRVPRRQEESFHDVMLTVDRKKCPLRGAVAVPAMETRVKTIRVMGNDSLYRPVEPVGKSCSQVGRDNNGVTGTDSEMFTKWSQAISSGQEVLNKAFEAVPTDREGWWLSIVLPLVVVPDGVLWVVDYSPEGQKLSDPHQVNHCSYFISTECTAGPKLVNVQYTFSHLEFITMTGLDQIASRLGSKAQGPNNSYFPEKEAVRLMEPKN